MAYTLTVEPGEDVLGWVVFVDRRPVVDFNRELKSFLHLNPGKHRLVVQADGAGSTVKVTIDGDATLEEPEGGWPLTLEVPHTKTGHHVVAEFRT